MDYDVAAELGLTVRDLIQSVIIDLEEETPTETTALGFLAIIISPVILLIRKSRKRRR